MPLPHRLCPQVDNLGYNASQDEVRDAVSCSPLATSTGNLHCLEA